MTTQIFQASTLYGAATLAAALDSGCFRPADRRILLVCNNAATPETTPGPDAMPGFERLRDRFDDVVSYNEAIFPFHPGGWAPRADDLPLWERYLRHEWRLADDAVELAVESIQVNPSLSLAQIFTGAPVTVYADGLMSYGPTRNKIDPLVGTRVDRVLHLDLVPGLEPLLLTEFGVPGEVVPTAAFTKVLATLAPAGDDLPAVEEPALLLGQYLSALDILSAEQEEDLHVRMLRGAAGLGHTKVVFKPHPSAPARWARSLEETAEKLGVELTVLDTPVLAEVLYQRMRPALVVGCFSTALLTASALYGLPVARVGTDLLLERLTPFENSNRVPVTVVDALLPDLGEAAAVTEQRTGMDVESLGALVRAVGFAMQPKILPRLRAETEAYLTKNLDERTVRYFKRKRLTSLALPGGVPAQLSFIPRNATVRRVARKARSLRRVVRR
ncbi:alpha-2,8-polysialyltransferase family protein [Streptomyces albidocamelliae]|uniref:Alpha-2,8-polysialyltransferase family protein n=1 Tax=Streptomyces albidocamelliae TaxID=2981135 RepID=A0ABY6EST0_9ACTN|nr:alpha-2,8-polysialyltransferase family protein [Streptomyces sp. HUAS 14-6]UXY37453.1 alpha-2,8-polysialyltransferase family protein [Streptomyces sp. HUAS 14-6]